MKKKEILVKWMLGMRAQKSIQRKMTWIKLCKKLVYGKMK